MSRTSQRAARPGGALISAQVVQTLLAELRTGRYASAARLPPELTLARTLGSAAASCGTPWASWNAQVMWNGCAASARWSTAARWPYAAGWTASWNLPR